MSFIKAKEHVQKYGLEDKIMEFTVSSATVKEAAVALNCEEKEIAKTLSFIVNDNAILIVTAGDKKIDNAKYKAEFQTKAKMIPFELVEQYTGHFPGGVCPFALDKSIKVYLDESLKSHEFVFPAAGSSNSAIKMTIQQLEKFSNYCEWIDVSKKS